MNKNVPSPLTVVDTLLPGSIGFCRLTKYPANRLTEPKIQ